MILIFHITHHTLQQEVLHEHYLRRYRTRWDALDTKITNTMTRFVSLKQQLRYKRASWRVTIWEKGERGEQARVSVFILSGWNQHVCGNTLDEQLRAHFASTKYTWVDGGMRGRPWWVGE